ncbi:hypothetical protein SKAU_G00240740 [Synaphobranchus kaupii]|uniref:Integral membrane protein 2 n=1 Tax=Synaphobranchus kaupii TaxID=118154 RepID=A0A9Q1IS72_SYNKA|nr:hypothetical protein SKAU_G00240740 [Synaphobranchus kaupii]
MLGLPSSPPKMSWANRRNIDEGGCPFENPQKPLNSIPGECPEGGEGAIVVPPGSQKNDTKKEEENSEVLVPDTEQNGVTVKRKCRTCYWFLCPCLVTILAGVVVLLLIKQGRGYCGVTYVEPNFGLRHMEETIRVLQDDEVELIHVPVPEFADSDPADIVHDFPRRLTAYLDLSLNKCYVTPLNTSMVMPPKNFLELLVNIKAGTYLPQSYLIHEQMMVTERVDNVDQLGYFIYNLCRGKDTYRLQRRDTTLGMQKREALTCHKIHHFENKDVVETMICDWQIIADSACSNKHQLLIRGSAAARKEASNSWSEKRVTDRRALRRISRRLAGVSARILSMASV